MGVDLRLPNITGNEKEQLVQIRSYLYQLVPQLQHALSTIGTAESQVVAPTAKSLFPTGTGGASGNASPQSTFNSIKSLIIKSAEIVEAYYSKYDYLPIDFIKFILEKYVVKTEYKGVEGKEVEYNLEKQKFNSLYGMSVTNMISDKVIFDGKRWIEEELDNEEIIAKLEAEKKKAFLSFAYGVWVTAHARNNLLRRVIALDPFVVYCDTDSCKLRQGYDKNIFIQYNKYVEKKIEKVAELLNININNYKPKDKKGNEHLLGVFECETTGDHKYTYDEFITQGAKKYAYKIDDEIHITVAGVPKKGATSLRSLQDFKDGLIFKYKDTNKNLSTYNDEQIPAIMEDYQGNILEVHDRSGICLLPNTYTLGKSYDYATLISDFSAKRSIYKE